MNKSESISKLAEALSKLQGEIQNLPKDKQGFGYKYTELASILDVTRPLCAKYELAVTQLCCNPEDINCVGVETILTHSSGEWLSSVLYMTVTPGRGMSPAQAAGSVITYARRYALAAILGIAQTDDDASIKETKPPQEKEENKPPQEKEENKPLSSHDITYANLLALIELRKLNDKIPLWLEHFKVKSLQDLTEPQMHKLINTIQDTK